MERFRRLGRYPEAHKDGVWCLAPCPTSQNFSFVSGGADGHVRFWSFGEDSRNDDEDRPEKEETSDASKDESGSPNLIPTELEEKYHALGVVSVAVARAGSRGVSTSMDGTLKVWDLAAIKASPKSVTGLSGNITEVWGVDISSNGSRIVTAGAGGAISVIDADSLTCENSFNYDPDATAAEVGMCLSVALSPDSSRIVVGSQNGTVRAFDAETGSSITPCMQGHSGPVRSVKFLPSDSSAILTCSDDGLVNMYDLDAARVAVSLRGHKGMVLSATPSPCGKYIASGSMDRKVKVWDKASREQIFTSADHADAVWDVMYALDGKRIISASDDEAIAVIDSEHADDVTN